MSWGYSLRSYAPGVAQGWWEYATLDPAEVHDCLVALGQVEGLRIVDGMIVPEASLEPCQTTWRPLPSTRAGLDAMSGVEAVELETLVERQARADRARADQARADLEERQRRARKAARTRARNDARIAAEHRRRRAVDGLTIETMVRIATDPKPPPVRRVMTRWASEPIFDVTVDRSQAWGHVIDGRACITEPGAPICVCGVNRLTWETTTDG